MLPYVHNTMAAGMGTIGVLLGDTSLYFCYADSIIQRKCNSHASPIGVSNLHKLNRDEHGATFQVPNALLSLLKIGNFLVPSGS